MDSTGFNFFLEYKWKMDFSLAYLLAQQGFINTKNLFCNYQNLQNFLYT